MYTKKFRFRVSLQLKFEHDKESHEGQHHVMHTPRFKLVFHGASQNSSILPRAFLSVIGEELGVLLGSSGMKYVKGTINALIETCTRVIGSVFIEVFFKPETQFGILDPPLISEGYVHRNRNRGGELAVRYPVGEKRK